MAEIALIDLHYLPSLEYFCALLPYAEIRLEESEIFPKQTYRNRCYLNTAQGKKMLTVPLHDRSGKVLTRDVQVAPGKQWRNNHWRTIESAYRKAPYFEHYSEELKEILFREQQYLVHLNRDLLSFCLRNTGITRIISAGMAHEEKQVFDLRSQISDKKPFALRNFYKPVPYYQVFGSEFVPNLSIIDLLLCEGPETYARICASLASPNKSQGIDVS